MRAHPATGRPARLTRAQSLALHTLMARGGQVTSDQAQALGISLTVLETLARRGHVHPVTARLHDRGTGFSCDIITGWQITNREGRN